MTPAEREVEEMAARLSALAGTFGIAVLVAMVDATIHAVCGDNPALVAFKRAQIYRRTLANLERIGIRPGVEPPNHRSSSENP